MTTRTTLAHSADARAAVFKALGEPTRLRIVDFLRTLAKEGQHGHYWTRREQREDGAGAKDRRDLRDLPGSARMGD